MSERTDFYFDLDSFRIIAVMTIFGFFYIVVKLSLRVFEPTNVFLTSPKRVLKQKKNVCF